MSRLMSVALATRSYPKGS